MIHWVLSLLFPVKSVGGTEGEWITQEELHSIQAAPIQLDAPALRRRGVQYLDVLIAGASYESSAVLRTALHRFKYRGVKLLGKELGTIAASAAHHLMQTEGTVLCAVPLHWSRHFARGFNQSDVIAGIVAEVTGMRTAACLRRTRATGHQAHRSRAERITALHNVFSVTQKIPAHVVLVDDVATTGSTLNACAHALKCGGALKVSALVVALADDTLCPSSAAQQHQH